ncbi:hypothetical protein HOY82DRAFT_605028 [Tuber indicum]|nr:hypothetical protein HOY82DRAFT_605028 [Tuber indicum]
MAAQHYNVCQHCGRSLANLGKRFGHPTMSRPEITIQTSNFMAGNTISDPGGGGSANGGGDTPIVPSGSAADFTDGFQVGRRRTEGEGPSYGWTGGVRGARDGIGREGARLVQDFWA